MKRRFRCGLLVALGFAIVGCTGSQSGTESALPAKPDCNTLQTIDLGPNDNTKLGSVQDLVREVAGIQSTSLRWFGHGENGTFADTQLDVQFMLDSTSGRYVDQVEADGSSTGCGPYLELQGTMAFETEDGTFVEAFPGTLHRDASELRFSGELPFVDLSGNYETSGITEAGGAPWVLVVRTTLSPLVGAAYARSASTAKYPQVPHVAEWGRSY